MLKTKPFEEKNNNNKNNKITKITITKENNKITIKIRKITITKIKITKIHFCIAYIGNKIQ